MHPIQKHILHTRVHRRKYVYYIVIKSTVFTCTLGSSRLSTYIATSTRKQTNQLLKSTAFPTELICNQPMLQGRLRSTQPKSIGRPDQNWKLDCDLDWVGFVLDYHDSVNSNHHWKSTIKKATGNYSQPQWQLRRPKWQLRRSNSRLSQL